MGILARLQKSRNSHPRQVVYVTHTNAFFKIHSIHNDDRDHPLVLKNIARFILTTKHLYVGSISFVQYLKELSQGYFCISNTHPPIKLLKRIIPERMSEIPLGRKSASGLCRDQLRCTSTLTWRRTLCSRNQPVAGERRSSNRDRDCTPSPS